MFGQDKNKDEDRSRILACKLNGNPKAYEEAFRVEREIARERNLPDKKLGITWGEH